MKEKDHLKTKRNIKKCQNLPVQQKIKLPSPKEHNI